MDRGPKADISEASEATMAPREGSRCASRNEAAVESIGLAWAGGNVGERMAGLTDSWRLVAEGRETMVLVWA
jgi:hypothetical protein